MFQLIFSSPTEIKIVTHLSFTATPTLDIRRLPNKQKANEKAVYCL